MFNLKIKKEQAGVLLALLAVVILASAVYVYRTHIVSESFGGYESEEDEDDEVGEEGFGNYAAF